MKRDYRMPGAWEQAYHWIPDLFSQAAEHMEPHQHRAMDEQKKGVDEEVTYAKQCLVEYVGEQVRSERDYLPGLSFLASRFVEVFIDAHRRRKQELAVQEEKIATELQQLRMEVREARLTVDAERAEIKRIKSSDRVVIRNFALALGAVCITAIIVLGLALLLTRLPTPPTGITINYELGATIAGLLGGGGIAAAGVTYAIKALKAIREKPEADSTKNEEE